MIAERDLCGTVPARSPARRAHRAAGGALGDRWEINDAHEDYRALRKELRSRLRYLLTLLAKELVARANGIEHAPALDALVEVLAHAERNLRGA